MLNVIEDFRLDIVIPATKMTQGETVTKAAQIHPRRATTEMESLFSHSG